MIEQPPTLAENTSSGQSHLASEKLKPLLRALNQLKSDISGVEARHPGLGSELSSLCGAVIDDLNNRDPHSGGYPQAYCDNLNVILDKQTAKPELIPAAKHKTNPVLSVIDKAGSHLITGLDKTGDGIIFILGKLTGSNASRANSTTRADADR